MRTIVWVAYPGSAEDSALTWNVSWGGENTHVHVRVHTHTHTQTLPLFLTHKYTHTYNTYKLGEHRSIYS